MKAIIHYLKLGYYVMASIAYWLQAIMHVKALEYD